jgi:hypothetical protein
MTIAPNLGYFSGSLGLAVIVTPAVQLPPELAVYHGNSQSTTSHGSPDFAVVWDPI